MKRIVLVASMTAVAAVGFFLLGSTKSAEGPPQSTGKAGAASSAPVPAPQAVPVIAARVVRRDMRQSLDVSGSLKTDEDVQIGSRVAGRVAQVYAKEGDRVRSGQLLVRLDDRELRAEVTRARAALASAQSKRSLARNQSTWKDTAARSDHERALANLASARAKLQQAETGYKLVDVEARLKVETGMSGVRVATERLAIARDLTRKQDLRQAQLGIDQASARLDQARVDADNARQMMERRRELLRQDAIAKEEVDEADRRYQSMQAAVRVAEADLAGARARLDLAEEGSRPEEVRIAEGQLAAAQRNLEQAKSDERRREVALDEIAGAKAAIQQAEAGVRTAEAGLVQSRMSVDEIAGAAAMVAHAQAEIAVLETQLADLTIRAPVGGVISTRQVNAGEMVTTSSVLMNLVALESVYFEAQAPELEVGLLRPGASARVTVDSLPGRAYKGVVREIIPVADRGTRAFRVRVAVLGGGGKLPAGGYARAAVYVGTHPGALAVAKSAVHTEAGDSYVWLIDKDPEKGTVARRRVVKLGLVDDRYVEILGGIEAGQQVIDAGSPAIIDGTPVSAGG